jgi:hypothetical protein
MNCFDENNLYNPSSAQLILMGSNPTKSSDLPKHKSVESYQLIDLKQGSLGYLFCTFIETASSR